MPEEQPKTSGGAGPFFPSNGENRFRAILDAINDAIFVIDFSTARIVDVNQRACELYGYTYEEFLALPAGALSDISGAYNYSQARRWARKVIQHGPQILEWQTRRSDGHLFWIEVNMREAEIDGENRLLMVVRDITARKRAEQVQLVYFQISNAVLLSKNLAELYHFIHQLIGQLMPARNFYIAMYDALFDRISYPYFVDEFDEPPQPHKTDNGLTSYVLRTKMPLLAAPEVFAELVARGEVDPMGAESFDWLGVPLMTSGETIGVMAVQTYHTDERLTAEHKDLLTFVSTQIAMAIDRQRVDDSYRAMAATLHNSDSLYRRAIEAAGAVPYYQDYLSGRYIFMGENLRDLLGYDPATFSPDIWREILQREVHIGESSRYAGTEAAIQARSGKLLIWQADNLVRAANGELRWIYDVAVEIIGEDGESKGSMGILQDVTERKLAEEKILKMNEELEIRVQERTAQLEQAMREIESFSYSVSHDLRAPLRALNGYARILLEDFAGQIPEGAEKYLTGIDANARQMGQLIDDILALSRLSRQPLRLQHLDQLDIIQQVLHTLQPDLEGRDLDIYMPKSLEAHGDPTLLYQVWLNLLSNAIKFTRKRKPAIIEIGSFDQDGETVFFIKDNGAGFDMKYADKMFGVFQRLHRAEDFEGTGVGLAIVHRLIQRHGGRVWAESAVDQGAKFYFTLESSKPSLNKP
jgi:PAS domain S-box-containing protein